MRVFSSRIGRRIGLTVGGAMAVLALVALAILLGSVSRAEEASAERMLDAVAHALSASYGTFDGRLQQHPAAEMVAELADGAALRHLDVFDENGKIRWSAQPGRVGKPIEPSVLAAIDTRTASAAAKLAPEDLTRIRPLRNRAQCRSCHAGSGDVIGGIRVVGDRDLIAGAGDITLFAVTVTLLLIGLLTGLLIALLDRGVATPIARLADAMNKAEGGEFFGRAEVEGDDEIGDLAARYNTLIETITDLRVDSIESERTLDGVKGELALAARLSEQADELESANAELERRVTQLSFLYELGKELATQLDVDALLERFSALVHEALDVPEFAVLLLDPSARGDDARPMLRIHRATGFAEGLVDVGRVFDPKDTIAGMALEANRPIHVPNVDVDQRPVAYRASPAGTLMAVPVSYQQQAIGVLCFSSPHAAAFSESARELFAAIGHQAALALANAQLFAETVELSMTDGLTGLLNRRALDSRLDLEWSKCSRYEDRLSLVMIDIDFFKQYNDQHGHQLGDEALRRVAKIISRRIRKVDAVGRYGGEEFVVVLPRISRKEAETVANKLRRSVEQADFERGYMQPLGRVTISCGVATAPEDASDLMGLVRAADEALFAAKRGGRNKVAVAGRGKDA